MALLGIEPVLLLLGIEMRPGRGEGRLALADGVDVEGVLAGRQP
jgi:hypothetical protein